MCVWSEIACDVVPLWTKMGSEEHGHTMHIHHTTPRLQACRTRLTHTGKVCQPVDDTQCVGTFGVNSNQKGVWCLQRGSLLVVGSATLLVEVKGHQSETSGGFAKTLGLLLEGFCQDAL